MKEIVKKELLDKYIKDVKHADLIKDLFSDLLDQHSRYYEIFLLYANGIKFDLSTFGLSYDVLYKVQIDNISS